MEIHNWFSDGLDLKALITQVLAVNEVLGVDCKQNSHFNYPPVATWNQTSIKEKSLRDLKTIQYK